VSVAPRRVTVVAVPLKGSPAEPLRVVFQEIQDGGAKVTITGASAAQVDYRADEQLETEVRTHATPILDRDNAEPLPDSALVIDAGRSVPIPPSQTQGVKYIVRGLTTKAIRVVVRIVEWAAQVFPS
jgi:hypothetical protein